LFPVKKGEGAAVEEMLCRGASLADYHSRNIHGASGRIQGEMWECLKNGDSPRGTVPVFRGRRAGRKNRDWLKFTRFSGNLCLSQRFPSPRIGGVTAGDLPPLRGRGMPFPYMSERGQSTRDGPRFPRATCRSPLHVKTGTAHGGTVPVFHARRAVPLRNKVG